ncbi:MAG: Ig-like domain-containing protein [Pirellulales bacterium]
MSRRSVHVDSIRRGRASGRPNRVRRRPTFEPLETRDLLAVASLPDVFSLAEDTPLDIAPIQDVVARQSQWRYLTANGDPTQVDVDFESTWHSQGLDGAFYDGPEFNTGIAPFDHGGVDGFFGTPVWVLGVDVHFDPFPGEPGKPDTAYFWRTFDYDGDPAQVTGIVAEILADDGAVFYLNGEEVGRINMGDQADTFAARALTSTEEWRFMTVDLSNRLVQGENLLAVSVHNVSFHSADLGFDMSLRVSGEFGNVLDNDTSDLAPPDDVLRVVEVGGVAVGDEPMTVDTEHGAVTMRPDGTFIYTPAANYHGLDTFDYVAADAQGVSSPTRVTLEIAAVNDAPVSVADAYTLAEDTTFVADAPIASLVLLPRGATWDYFDDITNGFTTDYFGGDATPEEDYPRDAASRSWFDVQFDLATSDPAIGSWSSAVAPFAQGGILAFSEPFTVLGNTAHSNTTDLFRNRFTLTVEQAHAEWLWVTSLIDDGGILYINGQEAQRWNMPSGPVTTRTLAQNSNGVEQYETQPINVAGLLRGGVNLITFELHQSGINTSDRGFDLELTLTDPNARGVTINDADAENSPLIAQLVDPPQHGTVVLEPSGRFTYTPDLDYYGADSFTYTVTDSGTPPATSLPATVHLTITPVPDTLAAAADTFETDEDVPILDGNVLANDSSEDGPLAAALFEQAAHGEVALLSDGTFAYLPDANYFGVDSFRYRVTDAVNDFDVVMVEITVHPVNDPPTIAAPPVYQAREDQPLVVTLPPAEPLLVVDTGSAWAYNQSIAIGTELLPPGAYPTDPTHPDADWNDPQFSIAASSLPWLSGPSPFAVGTISGLSSGPVTTLQNRGINTILFRTTFELTAAQAAAADVAMFAALVDDGGVLYVNGREALRINLPGEEEIDPETLALSPGLESQRAHTFAIGGLVVPGANVLAFELHQAPAARSESSEYLRVSEIMYHAGDPTAEEEAAGFDDDGYFEYLELVNTSERFPIDLTGGRFLNGVTFQFGAATLAPSQRGVIVADEAAFRMRYGDGPRILGEYTGGLSNGGERLQLQAASGPTIFDFSYGDGNSPGWPVEADGDGRSLVIVDPHAATDDWNLPAQWRASTNDGGSPGAVDPGEPTAHAVDDAAFDAVLQIAFADGLLAGAADVEGSGLSVVLLDPPAHGSLDFAADGSFSYTPDRNFFGEDSFRYAIVDDDPLGPATSEPIVATIRVAADSQVVTCEDVDWNHNGAIDAGDVAGIAARYGAVVNPGAEADFNGDGVVGLGDLVRLQAMLGTSCNAASAATSASAELVARAAAVDAVHDRAATSGELAVVRRRAARAAVAEQRRVDRAGSERRAESTVGVQRRLSTPSVRRALGQLRGDRADELV